MEASLLGVSADQKKLSYFQFVWITFLLTSAGPFGFEYTVYAVGVGYALLLAVLFALLYALPIALISSELSGLMPSRHGQIAWGYRAFYKLGPNIGDFIGFLNAVNVVMFWALTTAVLPIILGQYLETMVGPLSGTSSYCLKLGVILSGLLLNYFNFSIIAYITSILCIVMVIPFFVVFFWTLPDINPSTQWVDCTGGWALALTTCLWEFSGFESLGNFVNEIKFKPRNLISAYALAILIDTVLLEMPIISSAVLASGAECSSWFDGYFAASASSLSETLEYSIALGSVVINWCSYVTAVGVVSRMLWATAQPYFEITSDGRMVTSMTSMHEPRDNTTHIAVNILPHKFIGEVVKKTGSPIYAVILVTLFVALTNMYLRFDELVEFALFIYFVPFCIEILAYLSLKYSEPNAPRPFVIPFGKTGAWITVIVVAVAMTVCFWVIVMDEAVLFLVALGIDMALIAYYFIGKRCCHRMHQDDIVEDDGDDYDYATDISSKDRDHESSEYAEIQPLI